MGTSNYWSNQLLNYNGSPLSTNYQIPSISLSRQTYPGSTGLGTSITQNSPYNFSTNYATNLGNFFRKNNTSFQTGLALSSAPNIGAQMIGNQMMQDSFHPENITEAGQFQDGMNYLGPKLETRASTPQISDVKNLNLPNTSQGPQPSQVEEDNPGKESQDHSGINKWAGFAGNALGSLRGLLPEKDSYSGLKGETTRALDETYDKTSDALITMGGPAAIVGAAMKAGTFIGAALDKTGAGTDGMTDLDAILDSDFLKLTPFGLINGYGGSTTDTLTRDDEAFARVGGSYTGVGHNMDNALQKAGKKYGKWSQRQFRRAQEQIGTARSQQMAMANVANKASERFAIRNSMAAINGNRRKLAMQGGPKTVRVGRHGMLLQNLQHAKRIMNAPKYKKLQLADGGSFNLKDLDKGIGPTGRWVSPDYYTSEENGGLSLRQSAYLANEITSGMLSEGDRRYNELMYKFTEFTPTNQTKEKTVYLKENGGSLALEIKQPPEFKEGRKVSDPFELYLQTLPQNQRDDSNFRVRDYWEFNGKPKDFNEAVSKGMFTQFEDGWHAKSVAENPSTGEIEFMKSSSHPSIQKELDWYNSDDATEFRNQYELQKTEPYFKYVKRKGTDQPQSFKEGGNLTKSDWLVEVDLNNISLEFRGEDLEEVELDSILPEFKEGGNLTKKPRTIEELIEYAKQQNPRFVQRMSEPVRYIDLGNGFRGTHRLSWGTTDNPNEAIVYPKIFENENGELIYDPEHASDNAKKGDMLIMTPEEAEIFTKGYKQGWPEFFQKFAEGGKFNLIPEGALHARKHNMDIEGITKKGIPVVSEAKSGELEQQAEIEREEIIFRLEVTKKIEELAKDGSDEAAIEAGKLLVEEILYNTIDNTNSLI